MGIFVPVAALAEVPEEAGLCRVVGERSIALFRVNGDVFALNNVCPHEGGPLADGFVDGETVQCPLHAWTFDLRSGRVLTGGRGAAECYPVRVEEGQVLVELPDD